MWKLVKAELLKIRKRPMHWLLLAILIVLIVLIIGSIYVASKIIVKGSQQAIPAFIVEQLKVPKIIPLALSQFGAVAGILVMILAAANIGGEYSWGTLRTILARGVGRGKFLGAKVLALILVIASWALITVILAAAFGILISLIEGSGFRWDYVNLTGLWRFVEVYAKAVYSIIPYLLLAVLCSVIGRSTTVGIVVGILYTLVVDGVLVTVLKFLGDDWIRIANHSIGTSTKVLLTFYPIEIPNIQNMPPEMQQKIMQQLLSMPGQWEAAATILGYCVVFFGIAWYVFKRRDIKFA